MQLTLDYLLSPLGYLFPTLRASETIDLLILILVIIAVCFIVSCVLVIIIAICICCMAGVLGKSSGNKRNQWADTNEYVIRDNRPPVQQDYRSDFPDPIPVSDSDSPDSPASEPFGDSED